MRSLEVLRDILEHAQLERPDPEVPLWKYPVTEQHLDALLREFIALRQVPTKMSSEGQGALALLVANLVCEHLGSGAWRWKPVFDALRWNPDPPQLEMQRFREHIGDGLERYWCRKVRVVDDDRMYLASILLEGGLPLRWFSGDGGPDVQRLLQRLVRLVERYGISAQKFISEHVDVLPDTLRKEPDVASLLARMADALAELRTILPPGCESPADYLNGVDPTWRQRLPLPRTRLKGADGIIAQLLATEAEAEHGPPFLTLDWKLSVDDNRLTREVVLPGRVAADALAREIGKPEDSLPALLYLTLESSGGRRRQVARLERRQSSYFNVVPSGPTPRLDGVDEWRGVLLANGVEHGAFLPVGGEALEIQVPWVFDDHNRRNHILLTCGSCELRQETLIVSMPVDAPAPAAANSDSIVEQVDELSAQSRQHYRVLGTAHVLLDGEQFTFTTANSEASAPARLRVQGRRLWLGTAGTAPFWGTPGISAHDGDRPLVVPSEELQWRPNGAHEPWRSWNQGGVAGEISIRWRRGGKTIGRVLTTVLPTDFAFSTVKSAATSHLRLASSMLEDVVLLGEFPAEVSRAAPGDYRIASTQERPTSAELRARLQFVGGGAASVRLPIPSPATGFVGVDGRWIPSGSQFSLARTDVLRARGTGHAEFQLNARTPGSTWETVAWARSGASGWAELSLDVVREQLESMLSSTDLDHKIELQFVPQSMPGPNFPRLLLAHYGLAVDSEVERDAMGEIRSFLLRIAAAGGQALGHERLSDVSLRLLSLTRPWTPWMSAEKLEANTFRIAAPRMPPPGPYLAVAFQGESMRSRPTLLIIPGEVDPNVSSIASIAAEPDHEHRQGRWHDLVGAMERAFGHEAWPELQKLIDVTQSIPAQTFDWLRCIAEHPDACAMAVLRARSTDEQRMTLRCLTQLGVMAQAIPLGSWLRALKRIVAAVRENTALTAMGMSRGLALVAPASFGDQPSALGMVELLRCLAAHHIGDVPSGAQDYLRIPIGGLTAVMHQQWQDVLQRHSENQWPQADTASSISLDEAPEIPSIECNNYQRSVQRAPAIVASAMFRGEALPSAAVRQLRQLRLFDRGWFDTSHSLCLTLLARNHPDVVKGYFDGE